MVAIARPIQQDLGLIFSVQLSLSVCYYWQKVNQISQKLSSMNKHAIANFSTCFTKSEKSEYVLAAPEGAKGGGGGAIERQTNFYGEGQLKGKSILF